MINQIMQTVMGGMLNNTLGSFMKTPSPDGDSGG